MRFEKIGGKTRDELVVFGAELGAVEGQVEASQPICLVEMLYRLRVFGQFVERLAEREMKVHAVSVADVGSSELCKHSGDQRTIRLGDLLADA